MACWDDGGCGDATCGPCLVNAQQLDEIAMRRALGNMPALRPKDEKKKTQKDHRN